MYNDIRKLLTLHEGYRQFPYKDTVGKVTIGVGFNLTDVGLLPEEVDFILTNRIQKVAAELEKALPWIENLDPVRIAVLVDMGFNLGTKGLLAFKRTLGSVQRGDYALASIQMLESKWARQVGKRARRLANMMKTGEWPSA